MPSKHIDDVTWRKEKKETLRAVMSANKVFKETEILKVLIQKGLENIEDEDYVRLANKKQ